jgi:CysZ protein
MATRKDIVLKKTKESARRVGSALLGPVKRGGFVREFFTGMRYLFRGFGAVFSFRRDLWVWALVPVVICAVLYAATFLGIAFSLDDILEWILPPVEGSALWKAVMVILWIVLMAGLVVAGYFIFIPVMAVVSAPFNEVLSEKVEKLLLGRDPPPFRLRKFLKELTRTILLEVVKLVIFVLIMTPLLILYFVIPVAGPVIFILAGGFITSLYFAYDQLDRSFSRHLFPIGRRLGFVKRFFFRVMGFGTAGFLLLVIPGAIFFVVPAGVAGGTMLFLESDEERLRSMQEAAGKDRAPKEKAPLSLPVAETPPEREGDP